MAKLWSNRPYNSQLMAFLYRDNSYKNLKQKGNKTGHSTSKLPLLNNVLLVQQYPSAIVPVDVLMCKADQEN